MDDGFALILVGGGALLIGLLAGYFLARISRDANERSNASRELAAYKDQVAEHFASTAKLVNRMTDSYREVFEQLQSGAEQLIGEERLRELLADERGDTITLKRIGYQEETAPADAGTTQAGDSTGDPKPAAARDSARSSKAAPTATKPPASGGAKAKDPDTVRVKAATGEGAGKKPDDASGEGKQPGKEAADGGSGQSPAGKAGSSSSAGKSASADAAKASSAKGAAPGAGGKAAAKPGKDSGTDTKGAGKDSGTDTKGAGKDTGKEPGKAAAVNDGKSDGGSAESDKASTVAAAAADLDQERSGEPPRRTNGKASTAAQPKR